MRKIAGPHRRGGHQSCEGNSVPLILLLKIGKEESLIFLDRTAQRSPELIQIEFFGRAGKETPRIEIGIAEELEHRSLELSVPVLVVTSTVGPARVPHSAE